MPAPATRADSLYDRLTKEYVAGIGIGELDMCTAKVYCATLASPVAVTYTLLPSGMISHYPHIEGDPHAREATKLNDIHQELPPEKNDELALDWIDFSTRSASSCEGAAAMHRIHTLKTPLRCLWRAAASGAPKR